MKMRLDVVASPVRYRRTPLLLLLIVAVLPAAGLFVAHRWLDDDADRYDETRATVAELEKTSSGDVVDPADDSPRANRRAEQAARLTTSVFSYRRLPDPVGRVASANWLASEVGAALPILNATSCAAVSVGGIDIAAVNESLSLIPASTLKLVVAAVALDVLGADYTFETVVRIPPAVEGVIDGDVYLVGGGDPVLTADDYPIDDDPLPAFNTTSLDVLADAFEASGVQRINGTVLGDGQRYDDEFVIDSWGDGVAFDEAGPYDALMVNDARVRGRSGVQDDPNVAAAREFVRLLGDRGVRVSDGWGSGQATPDSTVIASVRSLPLSDIVGEMLINSDNNTAEMLLKEIGYVDSGVGTRFAGLVAVDRTLLAWGVPMDGVRIVDGSGLTPANEMTCAALLDVLQRSRGTALATGLATAGETGTLRDEFVGSPLAGRMFAKTGTLGNPPADAPPLAAKALAGYVSSGNGDTIEFVLLLNADEISDDVYRQVWATFADRFSTYPAGPGAGELGPR